MKNRTTNPRSDAAQPSQLPLGPVSSNGREQNGSFGVSGWKTCGSALAVRPGVERGPYRSAKAILDPSCLVANRNAGSGTRILIDRFLGGARPAGYSYQASSHNAVAAAIVQHRADWGVAIETVALRYGLGFLPLQAEEYDVVISARRFDRPAVRWLRDTASGRLHTRRVGGDGFRSRAMSRPTGAGARMDLIEPPASMVPSAAAGSPCPAPPAVFTTPCSPRVIAIAMNNLAAPNTMTTVPTIWRRGLRSSASNRRIPESPQLVHEHPLDVGWFAVVGATHIDTKLLH